MAFLKKIICLTENESGANMILKKVLPVTVRLICFGLQNNRQVSQDRAVIFASWSHAVHAYNQDYK